MCLHHLWNDVDDYILLWFFKPFYKYLRSQKRVAVTQTLTREKATAYLKSNFFLIFMLISKCGMISKFVQSYTTASISIVIYSGAE